jgi:hypothetical protein
MAGGEGCASATDSTTSCIWGVLLSRYRKRCALHVRDLDTVAPQQSLCRPSGADGAEDADDDRGGSETDDSGRGMTSVTLASERVSATAAGLARDFCRRVEAEGRAWSALLCILTEPIKLRQVRHPGRKMRPDALADLARRLRSEVPTHFRLSFAAQLSGAKGCIIERRLCGVSLRPVDDPDWVGTETDIVVCELRLVADSHGAHPTSNQICAFSQHALARRFQRGRGIDDAAITHDMALVANIDVSLLPEGSGIKIVTDADGGGWRGKLARLANDDDRRIIAVRTWVGQ